MWHELKKLPQAGIPMTAPISTKNSRNLAQRIIVLSSKAGQHAFTALYIGTNVSIGIKIATSALT
jgi:hypothetical protein